MASVSVETTTIREILQQYLPDIAAAIGTEIPEVTAEQIAELLAGAAAPLELRAGPGGPAAGLWVPALAGDTAPALVAGAAGIDAPGIVVQTANNSLWADTTSASEPAIAATAQASVALQAANNGAGETIRAQNSGLGPALVASAANSIAATFATVLGAVATHPIIRLLRGDTTNTTGTGLAMEWHFQANAPTTLSGYDEMYISAANNTSRRFWIRRNGNLRQVAIFDGSSNTTQTSMWLEYNGAIVRVKVGAAGSGPGGAGRALYID